MTSMKIAQASLGNVSVPGAICIGDEPTEHRLGGPQYIIHVFSRWGLAFEVALFHDPNVVVDPKLQAKQGAPEEDLESLPNAYELTNVFKLFEGRSE